MDWLKLTKGATEWSEPDRPYVDLRGFLLAQSKEALVELLEPYRQAIEAARVVDDFVHYRSM